ncbi:MAG: toxin-antitoxin system YwqK family antitoxin [Candidatus Omnitrophota bacterium]
MIKRLISVPFVFLFFNAPFVSAQELTMKTLVVSQTPFIVEEKFFENGEQAASLKIKLSSDAGGQKIPVRDIIESNGTIPDGVFKEYDADGQLQFAKAYLNGLKDGPSIEYYNDGIIKREVNYVAEKKQGEMREYYPDGSLEAVRQYVDNEHEGVVFKYSPDGLLESELTYERGATAWWKTKTYEYHSNGTIKTEYLYDEQAREGYRKNFHENGALWKSFDLKGSQLWNYQEYDDQGGLISRQEGPFNGKIPTYYVSGQVMQDDIYVDGVITGFKMYDLEGNVILE